MITFKTPYERLTVGLVIVGGASTVALAVVHAMQTFLQMAPCELCLEERQFHWAAVALALGGLALLRWRARLASLATLGLIGTCGWSTWVASYHAGVEWHFWPGPQACTGGGPITLTVKDLTAALASPQLRFVRRDEAAWRFLGISLAGWNAVASAVMTALALALTWDALLNLRTQGGREGG